MGLGNETAPSVAFLVAYWSIMSGQIKDLPPGLRVLVTELAETPLEGIENNVHIQEMPAPDPRDLRSTEVIIAIRSAGVGWVDLIMTSGQYQHAPQLPYCPGLEYSGDIVWAGEQVELWKLPLHAVR